MIRIWFFGEKRSLLVEKKFFSSFCWQQGHPAGEVRWAGKVSFSLYIFLCTYIQGEAVGTYLSGWAGQFRLSSIGLQSEHDSPRNCVSGSRSEPKVTDAYQCKCTFGDISQWKLANCPLKNGQWTLQCAPCYRLCPGWKSGFYAYVNCVIYKKVPPGSCAEYRVRHKFLLRTSGLEEGRKCSFLRRGIWISSFPGICKALLDYLVMQSTMDKPNPDIRKRRRREFIFREAKLPMRCQRMLCGAKIPRIFVGTKIQSGFLGGVTDYWVSWWWWSLLWGLIHFAGGPSGIGYTWKSDSQHQSRCENALSCPRKVFGIRASAFGTHNPVIVWSEYILIAKSDKKHYWQPDQALKLPVLKYKTFVF